MSVDEEGAACSHRQICEMLEALVERVHARARACHWRIAARVCLDVEVEEMCSHTSACRTAAMIHAVGCLHVLDVEIVHVFVWVHVT